MTISNQYFQVSLLRSILCKPCIRFPSLIKVVIIFGQLLKLWLFSFILLTIFRPISRRIWFDKNHFAEFGVYFDAVFLGSQQFKKVHKSCFSRTKTYVFNYYRKVIPHFKDFTLFKHSCFFFFFQRSSERSSTYFRILNKYGRAFFIFWNRKVPNVDERSEENNGNITSLLEDFGSLFHQKHK